MEWCVSLPWIGTRITDLAVSHRWPLENIVNHSSAVMRRWWKCQLHHPQRCFTVGNFNTPICREWCEEMVMEVSTPSSTTVFIRCEPQNTIIHSSAVKRRQKRCHLHHPQRFNTVDSIKTPICREFTALEVYFIKSQRHCAVVTFISPLLDFRLFFFTARHPHFTRSATESFRCGCATTHLTAHGCDLVVFSLTLTLVRVRGESCCASNGTTPLRCEWNEGASPLPPRLWLCHFCAHYKTR